MLNVSAIKSISGHAGAIYDVVLTGENSCFTTSADKYVVKWKLNEGVQDKFAAKLDFSGYRIALNSAENLLAVGNSGGGIHVIDLSLKQEVRLLSQHQSAVFSLTYCVQNYEFYSGDADGYFCVWNGDTFDLKLTLPFNCGKIRTISVNEDGSHVALSCQDGNVRILETRFFNEVATLRGHKDGANCAIFSGDQLYSGAKDAHIRLWDWKSELLLKSVPAHNFAVYDFLLLQDGQILVSASFDKTIKILSADTLTVLKRLEKRDGGHSHVVNRLAKLNESRFVSVGDDRQIIVWEINEKEQG